NVTVDWKASGGNQLNFPIGLGVGKLFKFGKLPVKFTLEFDYSVVKPDDFSQRWLIRFQMIPVLPSLVKDPLIRWYAVALSLERPAGRDDRRLPRLRSAATPPGPRAGEQGPLRALRTRAGHAVKRPGRPPAGPHRGRVHRLPRRPHLAADGALGRRAR